ncbi:MAG: MBL fold metallo-hydrolase [Planctomycetes bacterium]|nr:MBL fold metallo-hydrolase [Planctomycetota bacterium]
MSIACLPVGELQANCYVLGCPETQNAVIIDPGGDPDIIADYIAREGLKPTHLINTHGHFDHIGANREMKELYPDIQVCAHKDDAPMLPKPFRNYSVLQGTFYKSPPAAMILEDGSVITTGTVTLNAIHTPGHTPGGICLVLKGEPVRIFSGDTLFAGGVGRTDFPGGDWDALVSGIRTRLFQYPDDTIIYPGHGPDTTIGAERRANPFVGG